MKSDDYLWNKTGSDPEIEYLETALIEFRSRSTAPLTFPAADVLPFRTRVMTRKYLQLTFAAAASFVLVMVSVALWLRGPAASGTASVAPPVAVVDPQPPAPPFAGNISEPKVRFSSDAPAQLRRTVRRTVRIEPPASAKKQTAKSKEPNTTNQRSKQPLTEEERHAYNQLMLALSITGSNLRLVTDKLDDRQALAGVER